MSERLQQRRPEARRFGEASETDGGDACGPHVEATSQPAEAAASPDDAAAAPPATARTSAAVSAAQDASGPSDQDTSAEDGAALAQAVRRALGQTDAAAPQGPAAQQPEVPQQPEAQQPGRAETGPAAPGPAVARATPAVQTADEHGQPARPRSDARAALPAAEVERGFGHRQPIVRQAAEGGADALLGHVISVAGSVVWATLDPSGATHAEIGAMVRLQGGQMRSFGIITTLKSEGRRSAEQNPGLVEVRLLGEMAAGTSQFQRGVSSHPALDSPIHMASRDELRAIFARPDRPTVRLGTLHQASDLPAYAITDNLLGKHFAVLGTTGAGKSCSVTVILRAILAANPHGHIIMLDPHNEYAPAFGERAELLNPGNLKLPYWLLNFEEIAEVLVSKDSPERAYAESAILRSAILDARRGAYGGGPHTDHITVDTPTPYRLSELVRLIKEAMGAFNKAESTAPYQHLIARIDSITTDKRFDFMFSSFMVNDTMGQVLSRILRIPVNGKPVTIIDLSGVPSEIVDVTVSVLCRLVFEFALWSPRDKAPPILLVCEEAHRYVPRDDEAAFAPTKRSISRIAKEGRKYGLSLCLVTQRPAELSISSLSQCNTIFALRLGNEHDLTFVRHAVPDSARWLTDAMPALNTREAVVIGDGVPVPMHIRFDELAPEHRPASTTPAFSDAWQRDAADEGLITETIERWRFQMRGKREVG
jgi:DNA helicase HerA-like ATPase